MDKILLKFFADVLYLKGIICFEEYDDIMDVKCFEDLDVVFEKMMREEYDAYKRGDLYV